MGNDSDKRDTDDCKAESVTVTVVKRPPVAVAGPDLPTSSATINIGATVTFDGHLSYDPDAGDGKRLVKPATEQTIKAQTESPSETRKLEREHAIADATPQGETISEKQDAVEPKPDLSESAAQRVDKTPQDVTMQLSKSEPAPSKSEPIPPESVAETGALKEAHDFFEQGGDRQATKILCNSAVVALATKHEVTIASRATHWERYYALEAAAPEVQAPLRTLTVVYELVNYAGRALTEEQRNAALDAFRAIKAHVGSVEVSA